MTPSSSTLRRTLPRSMRWLGAAALVAALWGGLLLGLPEARSDSRDHELARQAVQQGKVLPLRTVIDQMEREFQGQVVKVEFEHDDGAFIYELRLLQTNGQALKIELDAVNGKVLKVKQKGSK